MPLDFILLLVKLFIDIHKLYFILFSTESKKEIITMYMYIHEMLRTFQNKNNIYTSPFCTVDGMYLIIYLLTLHSYKMCNLLTLP